jgi:hypothetical protein
MALVSFVPALLDIGVDMPMASTPPGQESIKVMMIKLKQAECGHWVRWDAPANALVYKRVTSAREIEDKDVPVVFCKKCIERIENDNN